MTANDIEIAMVALNVGWDSNTNAAFIIQGSTVFVYQDYCDRLAAIGNGASSTVAAITTAALAALNGDVSSIKAFADTAGI